MKKHYYWLDLIRFLAAFMVVLCHMRASCFVEYGLLPDSQKNIITMIGYGTLRLGHEAVLIFFVLSGFLVGGKTIERTIAGVLNVKDFWIDRAVRIMLPLIGALLLIIVLNFLMDIDNDYLLLLGNLFSLQGVLVGPAADPLWSLSYEVWFYILLGGLCSFFLTTNHKKLLSLLIIVISFVIFTRLQHIYLFLWTIGALVYFYLPTSVSALRTWLYLFFTILFLVGLQLTSESKSVNLNIKYLSLDRDFLQILFALSFSLVVNQLIRLEPKKKILISLNRIGTKLAAFSYTLYLTHFSFIYFFSYLGLPKSTSINITSVGLFLFQVIICLILSYCVYFLFEKQTDRIKSLIKSKLQ